MRDEVGLLRLGLFDVQDQTAIQVDHLHLFAHVVRLDHSGDVLSDWIERQRRGHVLDCDVLADECIRLLEQLALGTSSSCFWVIVVVDHLIDLGDQRVVVQDNRQEGIGRQDFVGSLQLFEQRG